MKIKATIVMVTYNCIEYVERAIKSIVSQDYNDMELIIIDGGSTDGTLDILRLYDEYINILVSETDSGIYDAMNKGIKLATGDIIGFLGSDDVFLPGAISAIVKGFQESNADVVYGNVFYHRINGDEYFDYAKLDFNNYVHKNILCHQSLFVRTTLQKAMLFDLSYRIVADYKFLMTLYFAGCKFYHVPSDIAIFNTMGCSGTHSYRTWHEIWHVVDEMLIQFPQLKGRINDIKLERKKVNNWRLQKHLFKRFRQSGKNVFVWPQREIILFGTGDVGLEVLSILRHNISFGQIVCFWDNNIEKQGQSVSGVPINRPLDKYTGKLIIVTSSDYDREMCKQLDDAGLNRGRDYWAWEDWVKNLLIVYWQGLLGRRGKQMIINRVGEFESVGVNTTIKCAIVQ